MKTEEQIEAFLADYRQLIVKHGLYAAACSCCDGPWLGTMEDSRAESVEEMADWEIEHLRARGTEE